MHYWGAYHVGKTVSTLCMFVVFDGWNIEISQLVPLSKHIIQGISA